MPSIVLYLLKCQICLAIVWLFYQLLLRRLTFYVMNRWYLLGYVCLSFLLPLVHIVLPEEGAIEGRGRVIRYIPVIIDGQTFRPQTAAFSVWNIFLCVLALGAFLLMVRLLIRWLSLRRIRKGATRRLLDLPAAMVYQVDKPILPFSFGNAIYIHAGSHTEKELEEIILHEYVHVRQRHTVDILLAELLCITNWYNPFTWLIRHTIRQNLEFIADRQVLASGMDRKSYQYHLLKVAAEPAYRLANNFNFSSLKKRIIMMNKSKSARLHLVKFLFIVPLLGALLVAFRDKVNMSVSLTAVADKAAIDGNRVVAGKADTTPVVHLRKISTANPLIIVDEVEFEGGLKDVNANDINSVNVLKKTSAFGEQGKSGVVLIYRKNYVPKGVVTLKDGTKVKVDPVIIGDGKRDTLKPESAGANGQIMGGGVIVRDTLNPGTEAQKEIDDLRKCLILVDGKVSSFEEISKLFPGRIASIDIVKDHSAEEKYGPKAKYGVVIVTTRGPEFKGDVTITSIAKGDTTIIRGDTLHLQSPARFHNK